MSFIDRIKGLPGGDDDPANRTWQLSIIVNNEQYAIINAVSSYLKLTKSEAMRTLIMTGYDDIYDDGFVDIINMKEALKELYDNGGEN